MGVLEKESVDFLIQTMRIKGLDEGLSKIIAILFLELEEISMDDLARKAGCSLATISTKITLLDQAGIIKKSRKQGSKKILLSMEKDLLSSLKESMLSKPLKVISHVKEKLPALLAKHRGKAKSKGDNERFKIMENYYKQVLKMDCLVHEIIRHLDELQAKELKL